ncbi:helix-turn-helix transcriptional regulator [Sphaerisporangium sp. TRM90804]|uniref:helix-turn-helix domain-containing protein n=1 Tax=Sphaerisporangium sp. TRM90804 TaxID=3031113 RepID=UPI00244AA25A|nr:helix-turn-helix transcriptional regulator [Sphaerisporangium sp. TRM90804]MDH2424651.1 helix-turn-helix transcriptional regulator [Sphaerisporangium sp. TRM90804]
MTKLNPEDSARARFAYELQRHRLMAHLTQGQLGRRMGFSGSLVGAVENLKRTPSEDFARRCDRALQLDGVLSALHVEGWPPPPPVPEHFRNWTLEERRATALQIWDPLLVPGIFQIEQYARRVFERAPGITPEEVEERLVGRMQRKNILSQEKPPMILSIIDEGVLRRPIGGPEVMRRQMEYLLEIAHHPRVTIQIVPFEAEAVPGLLAAFVIAEQRGTPYAVYVDSIPDGRTLTERGVIASLTARYDAIRAEAYPTSLSLKVIQQTAERWT